MSRRRPGWPIPRLRRSLPGPGRSAPGGAGGFEAWSGADPRLLANVRFLAGYRRKTFISADLIPVVPGIASGQPSVGAIERELSGQHPPVLVRPVVLHLLWTGRLQADLTCPLSADTRVRLAEAVA